MSGGDNQVPASVQITIILGGLALYIVALLLQHVAHASAEAMEATRGFAVVLLMSSPSLMKVLRNGNGRKPPDERGYAALGVLGTALAFCAALGIGWSLAGSGCASLTGRTYRRLDWQTLPGKTGPRSCVVVFIGDGREVARLEGDACTPPEAPP